MTACKLFHLETESVTCMWSKQPWILLSTTAHYQDR